MRTLAHNPGTSRNSAGALEPSWRPQGQSTGSLRQDASYTSRDLLEDCDAKWAGRMSEAIR
eukprot:963543-Pyramimonas_sp.AAC.1